MDYAVTDDALPDYLPAINQQLAGKGLQAYSRDDLRGEMNQLKALIDLCHHIHGIAVVLDAVYNHAGGEFGDESMYYFDRQDSTGDHSHSL